MGRARSAHTTVRTVNLARWLREEVGNRKMPAELPPGAAVGSSPQLLMKLDIEGSEYSVLPRLYESRTICLFNAVFIEFHAVSAAVLATVGAVNAETFVQRLESNLSTTPGCERTRIIHLDDETYEHDGVSWPAA